MSNSQPIVLELEIWSRPECNLVPHSGKEIASVCTKELGLTESIVLGLSDVPDNIDSTNLLTAFEERELAKSDFDAFCMKRNLEQDAHSPESAMWFLAHNYGRPLAWVHLPASREGVDIGRRIFSWVYSQGYCLLMPEELYCINSETMIHDLLKDYS